MDELKKRKTTRLKGGDYNRNQAIFLTICTKERRCILSHIVGTGVPDGEKIVGNGILDGPKIVGNGVLDGPKIVGNGVLDGPKIVGNGVLDGPKIVGNGVLDGPKIVGNGVLDGPKIELTEYGQIADKYIQQLNAFYDNLSVESYVIMPNHIHIMLWVKGRENEELGTPVPTVQNSIPSRFVSTFKRFCNKEYGTNIWQYRSFDHIIRNRKDYEEHLRYIYENPMRWYYDELYTEE